MKRASDVARFREKIGYVALLRGVNVGGNNIVPMKVLTGLVGELGCTDVRTYIQSGNVLFRAPETAKDKLPEWIHGRILESFGVSIPVVLRTKEEFGRTIREKPFPDCDDHLLHVFFLAGYPAPGDVSGLNPQRSPGDDFAVREREVYVRLPNGMARTKLTNAYFDSKLKTQSTARNWRTVLKLFELMQ